MTDKDITLIVVDTYAHELSRRAIERTLSALPCQEVVVFSDRNIYPDGHWVRTNPLTIDDYNLIMIKNLWPHVVTEHALVIQYDGMAVNPTAWTDQFLDYDYIGAVWPWPHHDADSKVGNGGFSLRSKRLLDTLKHDNFNFIPNTLRNEDLYIGVFYKQWLQSQGIVYPSVDVAQQFSHEHHPGYRPSFGFHGSFNVPYFLNDRDAEQFVRLTPDRLSEGAQMMIIHFFLTGRDNLGHMALDLARRHSDDFDKRISDTVKLVDGADQHPFIFSTFCKS